MALLSVQKLNAGIEDKEILHDINLEVNKGEIHVIMGPNGAGKSTLGNVLLGNPRYSVTSGKIMFKDNDVTSETTDKRAKLGMFYSFQNPVEIPGITFASFTRTALEETTGQKMKLMQFRKEMKKTLEVVNMKDEYMNRELNVGFSGGEKKKAEVAQLLMINPELAILDETDSGLDVDAVRTVSAGIEEFMARKNGSLIIITHNSAILSSLKVDKTHVLVNGSIIAEGGPEMVDDIIANGFKKYTENA